jgi:puromycin-sensitive aminopeptidase
MRVISPLAFLLIVWSVSAPALAQRLAHSATPEHYDLIITPDLMQATFTGDETIRVTIPRSTNQITLNAADVGFGGVTIVQNRQEQTAAVASNAALEQATFRVSRPLEPGPASIHIAYTGVLNDQLRGLYLSKTEKRRYAVSQLEATDARRMFPCFDEPSFKATFSLSVVIDESDHAISNGAVVSDTPGPPPGKHTVVFDTTPKMSTYLVALAVGDFACREGRADGIPIRICATPDKQQLTGFSLEAAEKNLKFFNRYYAIKYPFKKLDIVGVPDFAAGAMENTAAIFYRETLLLSDPAQATEQSRKQIAEILAHEMAHQWFGDLVTMQWWDDIWLNEGFATWMATKPLQAWNPAWHSELDEVSANQRALALDSLASTRAVRTTANTPAEIYELFDAIAYEKGAAILRMIEGYVGEAAFREGVNAYIRQFQYGNARAEDFWTVMARAAGKPVDTVMATFVNQPGVPLVSIETECTSGKAVERLRQERYHSLTETARSAEQGWKIPVCLRLPDGSSRCDVLAADTGAMSLDTCPSWVLGNAGGAGYYRVGYRAETISRIAADIPKMPPVERLSLVSDEWALVRAGKHDVTTYLELASALADERNDVVMAELLERLHWVGEHLTTDASRANYREWIQHLLAPASIEAGWTPRASEAGDRKALRAEVMETLGDTGRDPGVLAKAGALVGRLLDDPTSLDASLREPVVKLAAIGGDAVLYDRYLARARAVREPDEHYRYLYALARFSDPALTRRTLDLILSPEMRTQDAATFIASLLANPDARDLAWTLVRERWSDLAKKIGPFLGNPTVVASLNSFCGHDKAAEIRQFFADHPVPDAQRTLQQTLEQVALCGVIASAQAPKLAGWLETPR